VPVSAPAASGVSGGNAALNDGAGSDGTLGRDRQVSRVDRRKGTGIKPIGPWLRPSVGAIPRRIVMNDDEMAARIREIYEIGDMQQFAKAQYEMSSEDVVNEFPQSGERFRGRDTIAAMNASYSGSTGTKPTSKLRRIVKPGEAWVIEGTIDYGDGTPVSAISIVETGPDGKIVKQTDYFANPFPAPEWRKQFIDRREPVETR
jgi:hypothetical protein